MSTIEEQAREWAYNNSPKDHSFNVTRAYLAAAAPREELIAELVGALLQARNTVAMVHREFNSDRFTDRYGDGERATARLAIIDAAIAKAENR